MANDYQNELDAALAAVRDAARLCVSVQQQSAATALEKKDRSPVTVADFGSQALICQRLRATFPDDPIIAEEDSKALREEDQQAIRQRVVEHVAEQRDGATEADVLEWIDAGGQREYADRFWTLDPIDGTKGFLRCEQYAVALALIVDGEPMVAALACPNLPADGVEPVVGGGTIYAAIRGAGAQTFSMHADAAPTAVKVSVTSDSTNASFCESVESGHSDHSESDNIAKALGITREAVRLDSQAKYAIVARGEADIYLRLPTRKDYNEKIWDHAAGFLVVCEAGGQVSDVLGRPLNFALGSELRENSGVVVSNGKLHSAVVEALASTYQ